MTNLVQSASLILLLMFVSACVSNPASKSMELSTSTAALPLIVAIGKNMQTCWFKTNDATFRAFRLANETNSYAGKPRLLLVPKNQPTGLPSLVVEAQTNVGNTRLQAFGPLLATGAGAAISKDLKNWTSGDNACAMSGNN
jgi:hypothetical protein